MLSIAHCEGEKMNDGVMIAVLHYTDVASVSTFRHCSLLTKGSICCRHEVATPICFTGDQCYCWHSENWWSSAVLDNASWPFHPGVYPVLCRGMDGKALRFYAEMKWVNALITWGIQNFHQFSLSQPYTWWPMKDTEVSQPSTLCTTLTIRSMTRETWV